MTKTKRKHRCRWEKFLAGQKWCPVCGRKRPKDGAQKMDPRIEAALVSLERKVDSLAGTVKFLYRSSQVPRNEEPGRRP